MFETDDNHTMKVIDYWLSDADVSLEAIDEPECQDWSHDEKMESIAYAHACAQLAMALMMRRVLPDDSKTTSALKVNDGLARWNDELIAERDAMQAELAALRPWAELGKRAVWERWYSDEFGFICCQQKDFVHVPDCQITALLAQLEADNE